MPNQVLYGVLFFVECLFPAVEEARDLLLSLLLQSLPCHSLNGLFVLPLFLPLQSAQVLNPLFLPGVILQPGRKMHHIRHFLLFALSPCSGHQDVVLPLAAIAHAPAFLVPEADDAEVSFILHSKLY